jgi:recombinational DNA repair ATPase RecF
VTEAATVQHLTEATLQWLRFAEQNLCDIAAKMAEERDPTVRVLAAHALRYLEQAERDVDAALDEAAEAYIDERYSIAAAGTTALVAAGLARDRAVLERLTGEAAT